LDSPLQRHARDLERGHLPAAAGEPDGVRTLAAADIEHPPRLVPRDFGHEHTIGLTAPELIPVGIPPVPLRLHRGVADVSIGGRGSVGRA